MLVKGIVVKPDEIAVVEQAGLGSFIVNIVGGSLNVGVTLDLDISDLKNVRVVHSGKVEEPVVEIPVDEKPDDEIVVGEPVVEELVNG